MMVTKVDSKTFVGKNIIHVAVFKKKDSRTIYNMIYRDGLRGPSYIKRFAVTGVTRDKEYDLGPGNNIPTRLFILYNGLDIHQTSNYIKILALSYIVHFLSTHG